MVQPLWKTVSPFIQKLNTKLPFDEANTLLGIETGIQTKKLFSNVHNTIHNNLTVETTHTPSNRRLGKQNMVCLCNGILFGHKKERAANTCYNKMYRVYHFNHFLEFLFYCCSITVVCIFSPPLHPTSAKPTILTIFKFSSVEAIYIVVQIISRTFSYDLENMTLTKRNQT